MIFNTYLQTSTIPDGFKLAVVCPVPKGGDSTLATNYRQARSSHRFVGSNEPPFVRQVSFFTCSLYERALSCHHTASLQLKQRNLVERDLDCQRDDSRVRWASLRPRLRRDQRRPSSPALHAGQLRVVQKKKASSRWYQHFSSSSIAQRAVCHSCKDLQSTMKRTKESDMDGQAKLFSFGFSLGRSGNQPEPNPCSSGSSEQIRKPSSPKESTSSPLEEEQRPRSQSVTAPSSIPGFNIGRIGGRKFLCTMRSVSQKSWSRCWAVDHEAYDQLELIYVSSCVEGRNCMMFKR